MNKYDELWEFGYNPAWGCDCEGMSEVECTSIVEEVVEDVTRWYLSNFILQIVNMYLLRANSY